MSKRVLPAMAAIGLVLSLGGCVSLLPQAKPSDLYSFAAADPAAMPPPAVDARSITLGPVVFPHEALGDGILTTEGSGTAYITGARWVAPASILFRQALDHAFMASAPGIRVEERGEPGAVNAVLNLEVIRFDARYQDKGAPTVEVAVRARLTANDGRMIAAQDFRSDQTAAVNRVGEIVSAYDHATTETLNGLAKWVQTNTPANPRIGARTAGSTSSTTSTKSSSTTTTRQP